MKSYATWWGIFAIVVLLQSCDWLRCEKEEEKVTYDRTVLLYMVAENSLSYGNFHEKDLMELEIGAAGIPDNCKMVVYLDDTDDPRLFSFEKNKKGQVERKTIVQYDTNLCSVEIGTFQQVFQTIMQKFPSNGYGLIFWSHGDGWIPASRVRQRSIGIDNGNDTYANNGKKMNIDELAEALSIFPKLDFLLFDACFMQTVEVAYDLRNVTSYMIGSPAEIPNPGAPYDKLVGPMFQMPVNVEGMIDAYYRHYQDSAIYVYGNSSSVRYGALLSVVDCEKMDALAQATCGMIEKYVSAELDEDLMDLQRYYPRYSSTRPEFFDMNGYMARVITNHDDYLDWKAVFDAAVPYKRTTSWWYSNDCHSQPVDTINYGGVSCYVPQKLSMFTALNEQFRKVAWYEVSGWKSVGW